MNKVDWKVLVLLGAIFSVVIGFAFGSGILGGSAPAPGSAQDPLVTQSYADKTIDDKIAALENQVEELTLKVQVLENDLLEVYALVNKTPTGSTTAPSTGGTTTTPSTPPPTTGSVSTSNIGKTASISKDNNVVNLRKTVGTSSEIVRKLTPTDTFTITKVDTTEDWYQVQMADGTIGWVAGWLVTIK